ncbi:MAG: serine/threonine protein kinase [Gemmataceae bacterium]|nr:serine/threonine protein kinase [Gemmataceae bacterium]
MPITLEQFKDCLGKSGLMTPAEVAAFQESLPADRRPTDPGALGAELVKQKKLTPYQASVLAQGHSSGLTFGEYTVINKLGEGGMGIVLEAQHRYLKRTVALKVLHPSVTQSEEAVKRFHREVEAMARLSHPNIVAAYDANQQNGNYYFVMELVDGTDLSRLVKEHGLLPVDKAIDYILQAARGLDHAHHKGVIHRDIKPSNLVLDPEGRIKILDMGLVRFTDPSKHEGTAEGLTQTGDIMGSFDYIAPEQAIDTKRADQRADIYSLGCTLHYLLVGRPPYTGETSMQKLLSHRENPIPSLRKVRPDVPLALDAVFSRMVAKKADDRYPSMADVVADLEACRPRDPSPSEKSSLSTVTWAPPAPAATPGRLIILCGTACILGVVGADAFLVYEASANGWELPGEPLWKGVALAAGVAMAGAGVLVGIVGALSGRGIRMPGQRPVTRPGEIAWMIVRWLLGTAAGLIVGSIAGAAVGGALAVADTPQVRAIGSTVVGAFAGAALGRRRVWLVILGFGIVGYFVGTVVGRQGISLHEIGIDFSLDATNTAMVGFGIIGSIVGAVLGAERRETANARRLEAEAKSGIAAGSNVRPADDGVGSGKTVRRLAN